MKKQLLAVFAGLALTSGFAQTTATNFTCNDCAGTSHTLFTELDAGKVIVISFVMPCGTCIPPTKAADNAVQTYQSSNPGQVLFYMSDDLGTTTCSTLSSWATTNSITPDATFSNTALKMSQYGSGTMNRVVVLGGTSHTVYYNAGSGVTQTNIQNAINTALNAMTGIVENNNTNMGLSVFPNPSVTSAKITCTLAASADVTIDVTNILGDKVSTVSFGKQSDGKREYEINLESFRAGLYFIKLNAGEISETVKVTVMR